jgi:glycosyltransferase involved in cell wall biosynthesis
LITGVKWVADFRDDWTGGESQPSPTQLHQFINRLLEKFVLKSADHTIAMCHHLAHSLWQKSGRLSPTNQFSTIMNGYDRDDFSGLLDLPAYSQFTITHCGSISKVSDPEPFLKAIQALFRQEPDLKNQIRIQFIGTDIYGRLGQLIQSSGLEKNISPIQYLHHREAIAALMQSHLLLLTIFKKTTEEIITGKIFEYLASGKPILLISSEGEVARMVRSLRRGVVINNLDTQGIQTAILDYFQKFKTGSLSFSEPLSVLQFDREKLTGRLADIFDRLTHL